ncbi:MAG: hypothetical protein NTW15_09480 [Burkholderiales bacterium]|nr:hypothetical protein [Burkholderiales bacterium]
MTPPDPARAVRMTREEFASLVTHELRNPLNAMTGWLHLLSADASMCTESSQRALGGLRRALDQQLALIDTLGGVLRLVDGERLERVEPLELGALLDACAQALQPAADAAGRDIRVERTDRASWRPGDRAALLAALRTLGAHALRHGMPGATLVLGLGGPADAPVLRIGIDEGDEGGLSIWNGFRTGGRLPLDLLHAMLIAEAHGAHIGPSGDGRVGDTLLIRFDDGAAGSAGDAPKPGGPRA